MEWDQQCPQEEPSHQGEPKEVLDHKAKVQEVLLAVVALPRPKEVEVRLTKCSVPSRTQGALRGLRREVLTGAAAWWSTLILELVSPAPSAGER